MKIFQSIRKPLGDVGIYPTQTTEESSFNSKNISIILVLGQFCILSMAYILFEAENLREFTEAFYIFSTTLLSAFILFELIRKIFALIIKFEDVIGTRLENSTSAAIYANVNERVETWTKLIYFIAAKLTIPGVMAPKLIISFYLYFTTDLEGDAFSLPFPVWLPFDWKTPYGYLIAYPIQFAVLYYTVRIGICHLSFFIGSCEILMAFAEDLKQEFDIFVANPEENQSTLTKKLSEFVLFHCCVKQLIKELVNLYEFIFTFGVLWSISNICSTLLAVEMEMANKTGDLMGLIQPLVLMFWSFAFIFFYCDFGERVCGGFSAVQNSIEECNWYLLPIDTQKMLLTIMMTDRPVVLKGFANVVLTRETFKKVANGGYTYFTVLRQFAE